jgi:8-oxo-dGTP diphosphatase
VHEVVAAALRREDGELLLCHRTASRRWYPDVWDFPGGHVEAGESPLEALRREVFEEVGITASVESLGATPDLRVQHADLDLSVWVVRSWSGDAVNRAPCEHDAVEWLAIGEAMSRPLAHPAYKPWLATLDDGPRD